MADLTDDPLLQLNHRTWLRNLGGLALSLSIAAVAVYVLTRAVKKLDIAHVLSIARAIDIRLIAIALALVVLSYSSLTLYDLFALRTIGRRDVPYRAAALGSFTSYPIAHGVGAVALISPLIRYRIYAPYRLGA